MSTQPIPPPPPGYAPVQSSSGIPPPPAGYSPVPSADEHLSHGFWQSIADAASGLAETAKRRAFGGGQSDYETLERRAHTPGLENLKEDLKTVGGPISQPILKAKQGNYAGAAGDVASTAALALAAGASGGVQAETEAFARRQALHERLGIPPEAEAAAPASGNIVSNMRQIFNLYKMVKKGIDPTAIAEKGFEKFLDHLEGQIKPPAAPAGEITLREFLNKAKQPLNPQETALADHVMANSGQPNDVGGTAISPAMVWNNPSGELEPSVPHTPDTATSQPFPGANRRSNMSAPSPGDLNSPVQTGLASGSVASELLDRLNKNGPGEVPGSGSQETAPTNVSREIPQKQSTTPKPKAEEPDLEELLKRSVEQAKPGSSTFAPTTDILLKSKALAAKAHEWGFTPDELNGLHGQEGNPLGRMAYEAGVISKSTYESGWKPSTAMRRNAVEELIKLQAGPPRTIGDLMEAFRAASR